jgi:nucleotide-binding universal stress UspA family protein
VPPEFAYDPEQVPIGPTYVVDDLREEERAATHELVSGFDFGALTPEVDLEEGEPSEKIVERWGPSDLVVMGTHGHGAWARAVLGSCAQRVLEHARGAMLVVPLRAEHYAEH